MERTEYSDAVLDRFHEYFADAHVTTYDVIGGQETCIMFQHGASSSMVSNAVNVLLNCQLIMFGHYLTVERHQLYVIYVKVDRSKDVRR